MATVAAKCPVCNATREYPGETIGRYTLCVACGARFYVEVPPLTESHGELVSAKPALGVAPRPETTLDDVLSDTQKGTRHISQSIQRQDASAKTTRWLIVVTLLIGLVNLAGITVLLLRR